MLIFFFWESSYFLFCFLFIYPLKSKFFLAYEYLKLRSQMFLVVVLKNVIPAKTIKSMFKVLFLLYFMKKNLFRLKIKAWIHYGLKRFLFFSKNILSGSRERFTCSRARIETNQNGSKEKLDWIQIFSEPLWFGLEHFFNQPMRFYEMRYVIKHMFKKSKKDNDIYWRKKNFLCFIIVILFFNWNGTERLTEPNP